MRAESRYYRVETVDVWDRIVCVLVEGTTQPKQEWVAFGNQKFPGRTVYRKVALQFPFPVSDRERPLRVFRNVYLTTDKNSAAAPTEVLLRVFVTSDQYEGLENCWWCAYDASVDPVEWHKQADDIQAGRKFTTTVVPPRLYTTPMRDAKWRSQLEEIASEQR